MSSEGSAPPPGTSRALLRLRRARRGGRSGSAEGNSSSENAPSARLPVGGQSGRMLTTKSSMSLVRFEISAKPVRTTDKDSVDSRNSALFVTSTNDCVTTSSFQPELGVHVEFTGYVLHAEPSAEQLRV